MRQKANWCSFVEIHRESGLTEREMGSLILLVFPLRDCKSIFEKSAGLLEPSVRATPSVNASLSIDVAVSAKESLRPSSVDATEESCPPSPLSTSTSVVGSKLSCISLGGLRAA